MQRVDRGLAMIFGFGLLALALAVAVETIMRKVFNKSLQGVDELGGYVLAVTAALSFAVAVRSRTHIRIDLIHDRLPKVLRVVLNVIATLAIAACAIATLYMAYIALTDTIRYNSAAQTPWATQLKFPQGAWVAALAVFALIAVGEAIRVLLLAVTGRSGDVDRGFGPRGAKDELDEELADLKSRGALSTPALAKDRP
ncbi:MAG: TRAP transporter small permease [Gammaproteobacteria bacterium]|nr:TRAP transporter small permease [Gammaproteobacteria bacterium]